MKFKQWLWSLLPDECQVVGCSRKGMRGNENLLPLGKGHHVIICDYCDSHYMRYTGGPLNTHQHNF